ncbi:MAG: Cache 3/Cache 2 fusion domain-containing protein [Zoogloeaceae bacterium]|nr:Cache 3/Cache 2 fusion domain-containing protein [Zoogloeaceae bacterium]
MKAFSALLPAQRKLLRIFLLYVGVACLVNGLVVAGIHQIAVQTVRRDIWDRLLLTARNVEFTQQSMQLGVANTLRQVMANLPLAHLTGVETRVPELAFGDLPPKDDRLLLRRALAKNPNGELLDFLVADRDRQALYRAATLRRDERGRFLDGMPVHADYVKPVLQGLPHSSTVLRDGRVFALSVQPLRGPHGAVIGGVELLMRIDENINALRRNLSGMAIGKSGYVFVLVADARSDEDSPLGHAGPFFLIHPTAEGMRVADLEQIGEASAQRLFDEILGRNEGILAYSRERENFDRLVAFMRIPELNWIVGISVSEEELVGRDETAFYWLISLHMLVMFLLTAFLWHYLHRKAGKLRWQKPFYRLPAPLP